jgi:hypothetical protein
VIVSFHHQHFRAVVLMLITLQHDTTLFSLLAIIRSSVECVCQSIDQIDVVDVTSIATCYHAIMILCNMTILYTTAAAAAAAAAADGDDDSTCMLACFSSLVMLPHKKVYT